MDHLIFQWLPEDFQTSSGELRHLIQKQYPSVCQRDFARPGIPSAACQGLRRAGMVWTSKWSDTDQRIFCWQ